MFEMGAINRVWDWSVRKIKLREKLVWYDRFHENV